MLTRKRQGRLLHGEAGFTLIELLVVMAIIAILVGILFPTFNIARAKARRSGCRGNLHQIGIALSLYRDDFGVYPDVLYGAAATGGLAIDPGTLAPRPGVYYRLFPNYVKSRAVFTCPVSLIRPPLGNRAFDPKCVPGNPQGVRFCEGFNVQPINPVSVAQGGPALLLENGVPNARPMPFFPSFDSYDFQFRPNTPGRPPAPPNPGGVPVAELRHSRKWTPILVGPPPGLWDQSLVPAAVEGRQMIYPRAADSTVVTWCLYHTRLDGAGMPTEKGIALVLFLDGSVRSYPADRMVRYGGIPPWGQPGDTWQASPAR